MVAEVPALLRRKIVAGILSRAKCRTILMVSWALMTNGVFRAPAREAREKTER